MKKCLIYSFLFILINLAFHQTVKAQQVLGDFTTGDTFEWPRLTWLRDLDNSWDEGLIKMAANTSGIVRAGFGIHMNANRQFTFWSSGFNPLLSIEGGTGNTYIKGKLGIGVLNPTEILDVGGRITALGLNLYTQGGEKTINFSSSARTTYLYGNLADVGLYDNQAGGIYTYNFESDRFYINKKTFLGNSISFSGDPNLMNNLYYDNAFRYVGNGPASQIAMNANNNGGMSFYTANINNAGPGAVADMKERMSISADGKIGIGATLPESKLRVVGGGVVIGQNATANDTDGNLSIGDISMNSNPNTTTWWYGTNMLISGLDFTTIGFHDAGERVDFIRSGKGTIELGYDGGWGHANIALPNGVWNAAGNLGIGTTTPTERLTVNGKIKANEIRVDGNGQPDYVFDEGYKVSTLQELESYIKVNKHLPEIPSAAEAAKNGIALGAMNKLLLKKIEELTLHLIEKDKELKGQLKINKDFEARLLKLELGNK
jgi:hypothetical protein